MNTTATALGIPFSFPFFPPKKPLPACFLLILHFFIKKHPKKAQLPVGNVDIFS